MKCYLKLAGIALIIIVIFTGICALISHALHIIGIW